MIKRILVVIIIFQVTSMTLHGQIQRIAGDEELTGSLISAVLVDAVTGEQLESFQPKTLACPASVWKLCTTAAALSEFGPDFRFTTELAHTGEVKNGVMEGDLIVIGSGDPTLGSRHFEMGFDEVLDTWVEELTKLGIDSIAGNVIGNGGSFAGQSLPRTRVWEDMGNYYGSGIFGLNFNDNTYFVSYSTPQDPGLRATVLSVYPEVPNIDIESEVVSDTRQADLAYIFGSPYSSKRIIRGTLPLGRERFVIKGSIPDPGIFTAFHLKKRLEERGMGVRGDFKSESDHFREPVTYRVISEIKSPTLARIVAHTNRESDNLMAEGLLVLLGVKIGNPSLEGGLEVLRSYLKGIWGENSRFFAYDGSGLSRFTAVSAQQIADLLVRANRDEILKRYLIDALPSAGIDGSVKWFGRNTNLMRNALLKSGSMENVRAYAGTFSTYTGRQLVFAIEINNFDLSSGAIRKKIEDWLVRAYGRY